MTRVTQARQHWLRFEHAGRTGFGVLTDDGIAAHVILDVLPTVVLGESPAWVPHAFGTRNTAFLEHALRIARRQQPGGGKGAHTWKEHS